MLRSVAKVAPPCTVCPKLGKDDPKKPLEPDADVLGSPWFWDAREWYYECRAVGDFEKPSSMMRAVAAAFDEADRRQTMHPQIVAAELMARAMRGKR